MNLFQKSVQKELLRNFGGTTVILFTIVMTIMLIRILGLAARGQADPTEVILLIGLNGVGNAAPILTLSLFVSTVYTFSRMYMDSEMVIWFSSGLSLTHFLKPLWKFTWPILLVIVLLATWAWPWSNIQTQSLKDKFDMRSDIERVSPGQFSESASKQMVFFIEKDKTRQNEASRVFISKTEGDVETMTTAQTGVIEYILSDKFLALRHGQQSVLNHKTGEIRLTEFENLKFRMDPVSHRLSDFQSQMVSTYELLFSQEPIHRGELYWRIGLFVSAFNLSLLALQLASVNPRVGKSYALGISLLCFVGYFNMLTIGKRLIADGSLSFSFMFLAVHGSASLIVLIWYLHTEFNIEWRRLSPSHRSVSNLSASLID